MSTLVAGLAALGLLLVYDGLTQTHDRRGARWGRKLERLLHQAGAGTLTPIQLISATAGIAIFTFVLVAGLTSSRTIAILFGLGAAWFPFAVLRNRSARRLRRFREAWPDALATLISGVRAGISLPEACLALETRAPEELRPGFEAFAATYRATTSFVSGLKRMQRHLADPVGDRVVTSLCLAHEVGGTDLVRVLRTLSDFVREDVRVRKEIEARWSWTVTAARVAAAAPWVVLLLMTTRPEAARAYNTSSGIAVLIGGAVATALGYRLMLRAARLPEQSSHVR